MSEKQSLGYPSRRKEIVDAARQIAAADGWPAVTVRAVASRIGCSAPALYQYFRDKDEILDALAAEGRSVLAERMEQELSETGHGPSKRLRAAVRVLWEFAQTNPELYAVMFGLSGQDNHGGGGPALSLLRRVAAELAQKREAAEDAEDLADSLIAAAHGFIALALAGQFPGGADRAMSLLLALAENTAKGVGRK
ncbi:MAG TPA: TetR/AcrR family transcriptional regulator [Candidatus Sulfotelmatobacter sp.]|jgi:AcrR family transcriptional regulator|nr:TetR/AcrR family transcriptional regulator [Candidatus Sulfotelmatobacter sp.]